MRFAPILLAGAALAACTAEVPDAPAEPAGPAAVETPASAPEPDARAYFAETFSGRWGMSEACEAEGLFRLSPDELELYERRCEVLSLQRDGDRIAARTQCREEGRAMAENTHVLTPLDDGTITVSDGHYEWTRMACGEAEE